MRDIYPLTAMQQGMLVHALRTAGAPVYQQQFVLAVTGVADEAVLRAGVADLVARHTVLRTGFVWENVDTPVQVVFADAPLDVPVVPAESDVDSAVVAALAEQWARPFDLRRPPLLRAHAVRAGADEWRLVMTIHHLVVDGWSMPTVQAELEQLITARVTGRPAGLAPAAPFREFVTWLRDHDTTDAAATHFKRLLGDLRHPTPLGIDRVGRVSASPGPSGRVELFVRCAPGPAAGRAGTPPRPAAEHDRACRVGAAARAVRGHPGRGLRHDGVRPSRGAGGRDRAGRHVRQHGPGARGGGR